MTNFSSGKFCQKEKFTNLCNKCNTAKLASHAKLHTEHIENGRNENCNMCNSIHFCSEVCSEDKLTFHTREPCGMKLNCSEVSLS